MTLVHPSEAITILDRLTTEQPDRIYFRSQFSSGSVSEMTTCNVCLEPTKKPLCNYTDLRTGEPWFCFKPEKLGCNTRIDHTKGGFNQNLKAKEEDLFQRCMRINENIKAEGCKTKTVDAERHSFNLQNKFAVFPSKLFFYSVTVMGWKRAEQGPNAEQRENNALKVNSLRKRAGNIGLMGKNTKSNLHELALETKQIHQSE